MALFGNGGSGFSLKALLEDPNLQNPPKVNTGQIDYKKGSRHGGFLANANSAFLGTNLWEKQGENNGDFDLEYMDLDEFLSENGIPINPNDTDDTQTISLLANALGQSPSNSPVHSPASPVVINPASPVSSGPINSCLKESSSSSRSSIGVYMPESPIRQSISPLSFHSTSPGASAIERCLLDDNFGVKLLEEEKPASWNVKIPEVDFNVDENELALVTIPVYRQPSSPEGSEYSPVMWQEQNQNEPSEDAEHMIQNSIPGQDNFDPKRRRFTEEELKPQPIIKKSKKVFVEDTMKDDRYWQRRKKNNVAAKRSRDARRIKENQIAMRASFLEMENDKLKVELEKVQSQNEKLMKRLAKYENV